MSENFFSKYIWKSTDDESESKETKLQPPSFSKSPTTQATPATVDFVQPKTEVEQQASADIQKYRQHIKDVLRQANQDGPDYFEFSEALERNQAMKLERPLTFQMTFNSLLALGLTKTKLVDTAKYYITKLSDELANFKADRESRKQKEVSGREAEIQQLQQANQQKAEAIKKLTEEMNANNQRIAQLTSEKATAEQKIANSTVVMESEINNEISRINDDIQTIQTYIQ
jgi:hypothetical protein